MAAKDNFKFFENKKCEYYPCHKGIDKINCIFCYCPWFNGCEFKKHRECKDCLFPHHKENYDDMVEGLKNSALK